MNKNYIIYYINKISFILLWFLGVANGADMEVVIHHTYGGNPLLFDSLRYQTTQDESFSVTRLSYLFSGVSLEDDKGKLHDIEGEFYIDAQKRKSFKLNGIPSGVYRALHFDLGLNKQKNHGDPTQYEASHALNPLVNKLHWDWEGGYIFLALEGRYRIKDESDLSGFVYHLARDENRLRLSFSKRMDLRDAGRLHLSLDVKSLMNAPKPISFTKNGNSTHSNEGDPLPSLLKANIKTAFQANKFENTTAFSAKRAKLTPLFMPEDFTPYKFRLPRNFPIPALPLDNPLTEERVNLGKRLFGDQLLSRNGSISCSSCHIQSSALSDSRQFSLGLNGEQTARHSMPLFNLAWKDSFFWDGRAKVLREQVLEPIKDPIEMHEDLLTLPSKLKDAEGYPEAFEKAFGSKEITTEKLGLALEAHLLTLTSTDSKFDQALRGEVELEPDEQRGLELFFMEYEPAHNKRGADCFHCHGGQLFSDFSFHNNGLIDKFDLGRSVVTGLESDEGKFATPSLRNVDLTAPYMHDGRFNTLEEVVSHYNSGVKRTKNLDPNLAKHPVSGIGLSEKDEAAIVAFLKTLTDSQYSEP